MASKRYTRANPDPNPPPYYENPNLISRIVCQESSVTLVFNSHSCPTIFEYLEELDFDEKFEFSLFETKSKSALGSIVPNPDFVAALEVERNNKPIENFILRHLQREIQISNS